VITILSAIWTPTLTEGLVKLGEVSAHSASKTYVAEWARTGRCLKANSLKVQILSHSLTFKLCKTTPALLYFIFLCCYPILVVKFVLGVGFLCRLALQIVYSAYKVGFPNLEFMFSNFYSFANDFNLSDVCWASLIVIVYVCACFNLNIFPVMPLLLNSRVICVLRLIKIVGL